MIDIKAVYSSDAFSLVKGPSSAIARTSSIAEYGQRPMAFHHIVVTICRPAGAWPARRGGIQALARAAGCAAAAGGCGLGRGGKNP
jgi:hypothetical protein